MWKINKFNNITSLSSKECLFKIMKDTKLKNEQCSNLKEKTYCKRCRWRNKDFKLNLLRCTKEKTWSFFVFCSNIYQICKEKSSWEWHSIKFSWCWAVIAGSAINPRAIPSCIIHYMEFFQWITLSNFSIVKQYIKLRMWFIKKQYILSSVEI